MEEDKNIISNLKEKKLLVAYHLSQVEYAITSKSVRALWELWYPEDAEYFRKLEYKWNSCYNWISNFIDVHDTEYIKMAIVRQRKMQRQRLNKRYGYLDGHTILIKSPFDGSRLAKYLLIRGAERRTGDYGSLSAYYKKLKEKSK